MLTYLIDAIAIACDTVDGRAWAFPLYFAERGRGFGHVSVFGRAVNR